MKLIAELIRGLSDPQRLWLSGYLAGLGGLSLEQTAHPESPAPLTILYGSQTGHAREVAEHLGQLAQGRGLTARVLSMGDYNPRDLARERWLLMVVSTHGEGEPPDSAQSLHAYLHGKRAPRLGELRYGVLALGDSSYAQFCQTGREFDARLRALGATPLLERVECDRVYQEAAQAWSEAALARVTAERPASGAPPLVLAGVRPAPAPAARVDQAHPYGARWLETRRLTTDEALSDVRHLVLGVEPGALSHAPGDALGVVFRNDPRLVEAILTATGLHGEAPVRLKDQTLDLRQALEAHRELTRLHPTVISRWASQAKAGDLTALIQDPTRLRDYAAQRQVLDLLREHPGRVDAQALVDRLDPLEPRLYSIASSPAEYPDEVHLTVSVLRYAAHGRECLGGCSGYLGERLAEGTPVPVYVVENPQFRLPKDGDTPLILVGAGTGIAPFRAFLQHRAAEGAQGRHWLVFGNRHFQRDFLYQTEWQTHRKAGRLHRISLAFSRDQTEPRYVQQRLREQGSELYAWLEEGAHVYACGGTAMGQAVQAALLEILGREAGLSAEAAQEHVDHLRQTGRYQRDLY